MLSMCPENETCAKKLPKVHTKTQPKSVVYNVGGRGGRGGGCDSKRQIETTQNILIQEIKGIKKKEIRKIFTTSSKIFNSIIIKKSNL